MKKSQMIFEIEEVLRDTELLSHSEQAVAVLLKIESLGMKPPMKSHDPVLHLVEYVWENEDVKC